MPVEALAAALPEDCAAVISYAPSGSMYARLTRCAADPAAPPRLLAMGDPAFAEPPKPAKLPPPPDHGVAIASVLPNGTADLFGIRAGDVLLEYDGKALRTMDDLLVVPAGDRAARVPIKLWRDGEVRTLEIAAGRLGIRTNPELSAATGRAGAAARGRDPRSDPGRGSRPCPAPAARSGRSPGCSPRSASRASWKTRPPIRRCSDWPRRASSRRYRYPPPGHPRQGRPRRRHELGALPGRRARRPDSSDPDGTGADGRLTAEQIVRTWDLDADLVVLSACESGLGRYAGGEGYLGFAQPLFARGARSLVLSLWKVDDDATALLMARFYRNLLGKRPRD